MITRDDVPETPEWRLPRRHLEATDEQWQAYTEAMEDHIIRGEN